MQDNHYVKKLITQWKKVGDRMQELRILGTEFSYQIHITMTWEIE